MLTSLKSLKESSQKWKDSRQPDVIPGDIEKAIECLEKTAHTDRNTEKELILDDLEASLRSLKETQRAFKEVNKSAVKDDVHTVMAGSKEEQKKRIHQVAVQRDKKSILQPRPGPFEPAARWQEGGDILSQTVNKSCHGDLMEERTED